MQNQIQFQGHQLCKWEVHIQNALCCSLLIYIQPKKLSVWLGIYIYIPMNIHIPQAHKGVVFSP